MSYIELVIIAIGLSMDAFAVAVVKGLSMRKFDMRSAIIISAFFGGFQLLMPFIGWAVCSRFSKYISDIDHWIAFALLLLIGIKTIIESLRHNEEIQKEFKFDIKEIIVLAIATSIDALIVGVTFAFLDMNIYSSIVTIGIITFFISFAGVVIGNRFGRKLSHKAEILGGIILILIGIKILFEHLGIINF